MRHRLPQSAKRGFGEVKGMTSHTPTTHAEKMQPRAAQTAPRGLDFAWAITPHICRVCFSRILVRETFDRRRIYRCSGCGAEAEGRSESAVCCCGIKLKTGVDAGIRCEVNQDRSPEWPAEVTAAQQCAPSSDSKAVALSPKG